VSERLFLVEKTPTHPIPETVFQVLPIAQKSFPQPPGVDDEKQRVGFTAVRKSLRRFFNFTFNVSVTELPPKSQARKSNKTSHFTGLSSEQLVLFLSSERLREHV
jgi:hypothetical protein